NEEENSLIYVNDDEHEFNVFDDINSDNSNTTKFDISFDVIENENDYTVFIEYNKKKFEQRLVEKILNCYIEVVNNVDSFINTIQQIEYIPKEEKNRILYEFNNNHYEYEFNKLYHTEFSKVAKSNPDNIAIIFNEMEITFRKLDEMTNSLAHYLRSQGIGRGDIIPIITERSFYYIVAFIAVMKSGAAYLSIDPEFPKERIEYMMSEVNAKFILKYVTDSDNNKKINEIEGVKSYELHYHNYEENIHEIDNVNSSDDICYVLFTSGTTGKPKGTLTTHNNLVNYCLYSQKENGIKDIYGDGYTSILAFSKFTFDMSIGEIHYSLSRGCTVVLTNENEFNNPELLGHLIHKYNIKSFWSVPSRIENYIKNEVFRNSLQHIQWILFGGECLNINLLSLIRKSSDAVILNGYGPSETTVCSTIKIYDSDYEFKENRNDLITIGRPSCNYYIYILDDYLQPVPIGIEGEIFIGGNGVGMGYLNREELTNEKFISCPFYSVDGKQGKMYRTGDLGLWKDDGEIICIGRKDFQVKIRGQRIELSEIENTIKEINGIDFTVVIDRVNENGDKYLVSYFISNNEIEGRNIRDYLKTKLPVYMIPNYYIRISEIPITGNGKLDRKALPSPTKNDLIKEKYSAPQTDIEKIICKIYSEIFGYDINEVGRMNDFYEMGGDSLLAIRTTSMIEKQLKLKINIKTILSNSVICDLAKEIEKLQLSNNENYQIEVIEKQNKSEFPVTSQQLGVYIDSIKYPDSVIYNMPISYQFKDTVDISKVKACFLKVFKHQEILRSKYYEVDVN
ncbi:hypothetical protein PIROE2DRAFT_19156, partial [Piromyces sp. E2]